MSDRSLWLIGLVLVYALLSLVVGVNRLLIALYALPLMLAYGLSVFRRLDSPTTSTLAVSGVFVLVAIANIEIWSPLPIVLTILQLVLLVFHALLLAESEHDASPGETGAAGDTRTLTAEGTVRSIITQELRRSRRTHAPLSLLLFRPTEKLGGDERQAIAHALGISVREFDTIFSASSDELGILCVNTDRAGAKRYADRLQMTTPLKDLGIASFPEDAVTCQGLFDAARRGPARAMPQSVITVAAD